MPSSVDPQKDPPDRRFDVGWLVVAIVFCAILVVSLYFGAPDSMNKG